MSVRWNFEYTSYCIFIIGTAGDALNIIDAGIAVKF
jgi:hypothetical protein